MPKTKTREVSALIELPVELEQTAANTLTISDSDGNVVAEYIQDDRIEPADRDRMDSVVRAINAHDALVILAQKAKKFLSGGKFTAKDRQNMSKVIDLAFEFLEQQ